MGAGMVAGIGSGEHQLYLCPQGPLQDTECLMRGNCGRWVSADIIRVGPDLLQGASSGSDSMALASGSRYGSDEAAQTKGTGEVGKTDSVGAAEAKISSALVLFPMSAVHLIPAFPLYVLHLFLHGSSLLFPLLFGICFPFVLFGLFRPSFISCFYFDPPWSLCFMLVPIKLLVFQVTLWIIPSVMPYHNS